MDLIIKILSFFFFLNFLCLDLDGLLVAEFWVKFFLLLRVLFSVAGLVTSA